MPSIRVYKRRVMTIQNHPFVFLDSLPLLPIRMDVSYLHQVSVVLLLLFTLSSGRTLPHDRPDNGLRGKLASQWQPWTLVSRSRTAACAGGRSAHHERAKHGRGRVSWRESISSAVPPEHLSVTAADGRYSSAGLQSGLAPANQELHACDEIRSILTLFD